MNSGQCIMWLILHFGHYPLPFLPGVEKDGGTDKDRKTRMFTLYTVTGLILFYAFWIATLPGLTHTLCRCYLDYWCPYYFITVPGTAKIWTRLRITFAWLFYPCIPLPSPRPSATFPLPDLPYDPIVTLRTTIWTASPAVITPYGLLLPALYLVPRSGLPRSPLLSGPRFCHYLLPGAANCRRPPADYYRTVPHSGDVPVPSTGR